MLAETKLIFNVQREILDFHLMKYIFNPKLLGKSNWEIHSGVTKERRPLRPPLMEHFPEKLKHLMKESWHQVWLYLFINYCISVWIQFNIIFTTWILPKKFSFLSAPNKCQPHSIVVKYKENMKSQQNCIEVILKELSYEFG